MQIKNEMPDNGYLHKGVNVKNTYRRQTYCEVQKFSCAQE